MKMKTETTALDLVHNSQVRSTVSKMLSTGSNHRPRRSVGGGGPCDFSSPKKHPDVLRTSKMVR